MNSIQVLERQLILFTLEQAWKYVAIINLNFKRCSLNFMYLSRLQTVNINS